MNGVTRNYQKCAVFLMIFCHHNKNQKSPHLFQFRSVVSLVLVLLFMPVSLFAQSYLQSHGAYKSEDILTEWDTFSNFAFKDSLLYGNTGDQIVLFNLQTEEELTRFSNPADYNAFPSFLMLSPDSQTLWAGYTSTNNVDDRVYSLNPESGEWILQAQFPASHDMLFIQDHMLVSGLNSDDWNLPASVFLLDTTGNDQHRRIIETGGSSAGMATDTQGNLYYATYFFGEENYLYRWSAEDLLAVLEDEQATPLTLEDADVLSGLPDGAYDCEVDEAGNLLVTVNTSPDRLLVKWNGEISDEMNYDTLATTNDEMDWLTQVKTTGDIDNPHNSSAAFVLGWGRPISKISRKKPLQLANDFETIMAFENEENVSLDLNNYFTDPDYDRDVFFEVVVNSQPDHVEVMVEENLLDIGFLLPGQSNIKVCASTETDTVCAEFVVGVMPVKEGEFAMADFEGLLEDEESFWNGSDGNGEFQSGDAHFPNQYDPEWGAWSGWAYSNTTDNQTQDWSNQYSAVTGSGYPGDAENHNGTYAVSFVSGEGSIIHFNGQKREVEGFFVSNTTYAALTMMHGDDFSKKFGGETGEDPDWFKLSITGKNSDSEPAAVEYYLADFRFDDHSKDYIIQTWQWVDLGALGAVDTLIFQLSSSDVGDWGMNTPAYFALDQLLITPDQGTFARQQNAEDDVLVYPNPSAGMFRLETADQAQCNVKVYNQTGQLVYQKELINKNDALLDLTDHPGGVYMLTLQVEDQMITKRLIKANR